MKVFEAFAGVGSQRMALKRIGIKHEVVAIAEIDKYAIKSYMAMHGDTPNLGDISQLSVDDIPDHDLFTYSFPCTDISIAGDKEGFAEGSGTRSSLLWECKRVIEGKRPKYLLLENVKNIVGSKNINDFTAWLRWLESMGYKNHWDILNAKDFGVPQNRERVFVVSILQTGQLSLFDDYQFPTGIESDIILRDILEEVVPDKYFLSPEVQARFVYKPSGVNVIGTTAPEFRTIGWRDTVFHTDTVMGALLATDYKEPKHILVVGSTKGQDSTRHGQRDRVYDPAGLSATLEAGDFRQPKQIIVEGTIEFPGNGTYKHEQSRRVYGTGGICPTVHTSGGGGQHLKILQDHSIRKLTPLEYWRLMGFGDSYFERVRFQSDTQLYKQAGNSIVVPVLAAIFKNMFK